MVNIILPKTPIINIPIRIYLSILIAKGRLSFKIFEIKTVGSSIDKFFKYLFLGNFNIFSNSI